MFEIGPNENVFPVVKIAKIVEALKEEGVPPQEALAGIRISEAELNSPVTKVSANQIVQSYRNALKCSQNRSFAFDVGSKFHVRPMESTAWRCSAASAFAKPSTSRCSTIN